MHTRLASPDTDQIFPEYVRELLDARKTYWDTRLKGLHLFTYSMPTSLSSLNEGQDRGFVNMQGIVHGSHLVSEGAVRGLLGSVEGLTAFKDLISLPAAKILPTHQEAFCYSSDFSDRSCQKSPHGRVRRHLRISNYRFVFPTFHGIIQGPWRRFPHRFFTESNM